VRREYTGYVKPLRNVHIRDKLLIHALILSRYFYTRPQLYVTLSDDLSTLHNVKSKTLAARVSQAIAYRHYSTRQITDTTAFNRHLKTHLFHLYFICRNFLPKPRRLCFRRCVSVCLSVCLSATLHKSVQTYLHESSREGWQWANEQMIKFRWRSVIRQCTERQT